MAVRYKVRGSAAMRETLADLASFINSRIILLRFIVNRSNILK